MGEGTVRRILSFLELFHKGRHEGSGGASASYKKNSRDEGRAWGCRGVC